MCVLCFSFQIQDVYLERRREKRKKEREEEKLRKKDKKKRGTSEMTTPLIAADDIDSPKHSQLHFYEGRSPEFDPVTAHVKISSKLSTTV